MVLLATTPPCRRGWNSFFVDFRVHVAISPIYLGVICFGVLLEAFEIAEKVKLTFCLVSSVLLQIFESCSCSILLIHVYLLRLNVVFPVFWPPLFADAGIVFFALLILLCPTVTGVFIQYSRSRSLPPLLLPFYHAMPSWHCLSLFK